MANLYKIEREYKQFILGLKPEEITEYYRQLNKKIIECYPTLNSNWKNEELNSLLASVNDVTNILSSNYKINSLNRINIASRYVELSDKYLDEHDLAVYKLLTSDIVTISNSIGYLVNSILADFFSIYIYYDYSIHIGTAILTYELGVPEELLEPLEPYFNNSSSFYGAKAISSFNGNIEINFKVVEMYIKAFNDYRKINFNPEDVSEDLVEVLQMFNKVYDSGVKYIEEFEKIKKNPFKKAIEFEAKVRTDKSFIDYTEEDIELFIESKLASAPKYNFETFELILPNTEEGVVN